MVLHSVQSLNVKWNTRLVVGCSPLRSGKAPHVKIMFLDTEMLHNFSRSRNRIFFWLNVQILKGISSSEIRSATSDIDKGQWSSELASSSSDAFVGSCVLCVGYQCHCCNSVARSPLVISRSGTAFNHLPLCYNVCLSYHQSREL